MNTNFEKIQELLKIKAELVAKINLLPYDGSPEIKENKSGKYLYVRKRINGRLTSTYVDKYDQNLYDALVRYYTTSRKLRKELRHCERELLSLGYTGGELSLAVSRNLEYARINMKANIYSQAILEGVATTYPKTETIIENGIVDKMKVSDIQKILNLKHAWEFILDENVILAPSDLSLISHIAKLVNEDLVSTGGNIRLTNVIIGGSSYVPPIPDKDEVKKQIKDITSRDKEAIDKAIDLCLYCMKTQIFDDGNKRASVIFANHYLISQGKGFLVIPERHVEKFKELLILYYEDKDTTTIKDFLKKNCWMPL